MSVRAHLSYQALDPCTNKYLRRKWDMEKYKQHRKRVQMATPMIDNAAPRVPVHMHLKLNKMQAEALHVMKVEKENRILMENISYTYRSKGYLDNWNVYESYSLSHLGKQQELLKISHENQAILKRIIMQKPTYDRKRWEQDWRIHQGYMLHMSNYPDRWNYKKYAIDYCSPYKPIRYIPKISSWSFDLVRSQESIPRAQSAPVNKKRYAEDAFK